MSRRLLGPRVAFWPMKWRLSFPPEGHCDCMSRCPRGVTPEVAPRPYPPDGVGQRHRKTARRAHAVLSLWLHRAPNLRTVSGNPTTTL